MATWCTRAGTDRMFTTNTVSRLSEQPAATRGLKHSENTILNKAVSATHLYPSYYGEASERVNVTIFTICLHITSQSPCLVLVHFSIHKRGVRKVSGQVQQFFYFSIFSMKISINIVVSIFN